ncbi:efflux RND transporter periplasmic adaptor subunit [Myxococcota bacterium]|nr:efflux RND transporter periplasmic adaptor subunit [Myxococcota bacterium]
MLESVSQSWLALHCQSVAGIRRGVVVLGGGAGSRPGIVARWPADGSADDLLDVANSAHTERRAVVRARSTRGGTAARSEIAVPFGTSSNRWGAVAVEVLHAKEWDSEPSCKSIVDHLTSGAAWLERLAGDVHSGERLSKTLRVLGVALEANRVADAGTAVATELATLLRCERVCVGLKAGRRIRVRSLSHSASFDSRSPLIADVQAAMEEAADQDSTLSFPPPADSPPRTLLAHEALTRQHSSMWVGTVPLVSEGTISGAITFEYGMSDAMEASATTLCEDVALLVGPVLELKRVAGMSLPVRVWHSIKTGLRKFFSAGSVGRKLALVAAMAAVGFLSVATGQYRVGADATIEGRLQRAVVVGFEAYIAEARARAGDLVQEGELLARLDDRDLVLERRQWVGRKSQLSREYREALAAHDRSQVNVLGAQLEQANAQLELVDANLGRTRIEAPFEGVVVEGDLSQSLGSPVSRGDVLFEIAPLDGYRVILEVDERDIADVRVGQHGKITLSALPNTELPMTVDRVIPVSVASSGRNVFRVEAQLDDPIDGLRPGMAGVGKVEIDQRRWLWIWTHDLMNWLRIWTWSWWP